MVKKNDSKNAAIVERVTARKSPGKNAPIPVERVQLGVRMERSMVKVLKAMAEYGDMTLGELLEEIVLHSFEGGTAQTFGGEDLKVVAEFKKLYGMKYDVRSNYRFVEKQ